MHIVQLNRSNLLFTPLDVHEPQFTSDRQVFEEQVLIFLLTRQINVQSQQ